MEFVGYRLYGQRIRIMAFSCVHFGDRAGHDVGLWKEFLQEVEQTPHAVVVGLGDYLDFTRTTYRAPIKSVWGEDDKAYQELDDMVNHTMVLPFVDTIRKHAPSLCKPFGQGGKLLGLVEGNHLHKFLNGTTSTQAICHYLGARYLGLSAWIRLTCYRSRGKTKWGAGHNLNILATHSPSSAGMLPASLASAERMLWGFREVDMFLSGNDHRLGHDLIQQIGCTSGGMPRMRQVELVVGKAGSFQKGYEEGATHTSYVEKRFLKPSRLGWLAFDAWVHYKPDRKHERASTPEVWRYGNFSA